MADDEPWLALLEAEDVDGLNRRRTERTRIEAFAADLAGKKLVGADLSGANLEKSDLTGADLTDANLMKANLAGVDGSGAILREVLGIRVRLKDAYLDDADLSGADLTQADLADANLVGSKGEGVRLGQARLRGIDATGASWPGAVLTEARLHQAKFVRADLRNADLSEAGAIEADFTDARLDGISASGAKFTSAKLVGAKLSAARLMGANLANADLTGADLGAADLSRANLSGAVLKGAILRGAVLADANLEGANLSEADLTDADLSGLDPVALGLGADVVRSLSDFGVTYDESAPLVFGEVSVARSGKAVAVVWPNPEGEPQVVQQEGEGEEGELEQPMVMRFAVHTTGGWKTGVVPVPGEAVLDHRVVAVGDGFLVVVVRSRTEGASLVCASLGRDGKLGVVRSVALGYEPAVRSVLQVEGTQVRMFGLARRGPTVVIHDLTGDPSVVGSHAASTARGFMGSHPVLACKGGVVVRVSARGLAPPRRTPEGFPGTVGTALPHGDDILALWAVKRTPMSPAGIRYAVIGKRHAPKEEPLAKAGAVMALVASERPNGDDEAVADAFWVELTASGTRLVHCRVNAEGGDARVLPAPEDIAEIEVAPGVIGLVTAEGRLVVLDAENGKPLGEL